MSKANQIMDTDNDQVEGSEQHIEEDMEEQEQEGEKESSEEEEEDEEEEQESQTGPREVETNPSEEYGSGGEEVKAVAVKRRLEKSEGNESMKKVKIFHRIFSYNDEIRILEGLIKYMQENDGPVNYKDFRRSIRKSLDTCVNNTQLYEKVRRLKLRYKKMVGKNKLPKSNSHDMQLYQLSEQAWGREIPDRKDQNQEDGAHHVNIRNGATLPFFPVHLYEFWSLHWEGIRREGLKLIPKTKLKQLELKKLNLLQEEMELVLTALNSSQKH